MNELKANLTYVFDAKSYILGNRAEKNSKIIKHHEQVVFISPMQRWLI